MKNTLQYLLTAVILISMMLIAITIEPGHNWGDDFALYIQQASAILDGSMDQLYRLNRYSMQNSSWVVGPDLYPNGFPLLLAPVLSLFGLNFVILKIYVAAFFVMTIPLLYYFFKPYFPQPFYSLLLTLMIATSPFYIKFADNVLSDFPFLFLVYLVFILMRRKPNIWAQLVTGILIFFAFYTRTIGIVLIPTLVIYQATIIYRYKVIEWVYLVPYVSFVFAWLLFSLLFPLSSEGYFDMMFNLLSIETVLRNAVHYLSLLGYFFTGIKSWVLGLPVFVIMLIGLFSSPIRSYFIATYSISLILILIIWPIIQDMRFLFPLLPLAVFYLINGTLMIMKWLNFKQIFMKKFMTGIVVLFSVMNVGIIIFTSIDRDTNQALNSEMTSIYDYLENNVPDDQIVAFRKPRALRLFTGLNSIRTNREHFESSVASYYLALKLKVDSGFINRYKRIFETKNYLLVKKFDNMPHDR